MAGARSPGSSKEAHVRISEHPGRKPQRSQPAWIRITALVLILSLGHLALASVGWSEETEQAPEVRSESTGAQFGLGAASFFLTIPYGLAKVVYASFGGIVGGIAYAVTAGNEKTAKTIWYTSLRGTYVITPEHLRGERPVQFFGIPPENGALPQEPQPSVEPAPMSEPLK